MDQKLIERIGLSLKEKRDNLATWLVATSPPERDLRLGSSTEEAVQAHLGTLDQALEKAADQTLGRCEVCHEPVEAALLEMDYSCCVCLDHLSTDEARQLEMDLEMAGRVQQTLLPHKVPEIPGLELAAYSRPAQIVGGDYFDFFAFGDGRPGMTIADVAGHGMSASLHMASVQTLLRTLAPASSSAAEVVSEVQRLYSHNIHFTTFVTLFLVAYDERTHTFTYCNAGHNPALILHQSDNVGQAPVWLWPTGPAVGILEEATFAEAQVTLQPGDLLVMYTDGITEATNRANEQLGRERLATWLTRERNITASDAVRIIRDRLSEFTEGKPPADDITLVVGRLEMG
jgi:sigma-B regulation protein RsbU (phosphoserine phosphatase)